VEIFFAGFTAIADVMPPATAGKNGFHASDNKPARPIFYLINDVSLSGPAEGATLKLKAAKSVDKNQ
jgi:hypothetical protein